MAFATKLCSRSLSTTSIRNAIKNVTIIGGGLMGSGIAQVTFPFPFLTFLVLELLKFKLTVYNSTTLYFTLRFTAKLQSNLL